MKNRNQIAVALLGLVVLIGGCAALEKALQGDFGGAVGEAVSYVAQSAIDSMKEGKVADEYESSQEYYIGRGVSAAVVDAYAPADPADARTRTQIIFLNEMGGFIRESTLDVTRDGRQLGRHVRRNAKAVERIENLTLFRGLHVGILDTDEVCAFATPGGFIWISRGVINMCRTEDELAAIICHELAHIVLNHGMDAYREANKGGIADSPWIRNALPDDDSVFANFGRLITSFADDLITKGYSPEQELEADNWGTRALVAAGYSPEAMVRMLESVKAYEEASADKGTYLGNHPDINVRIGAVRKLIDDNAQEFRGQYSTDGLIERGRRFHVVFKD
jgi:Zn-dependent protease with chaperone function